LSQLDDVGLEFCICKKMMLKKIAITVFCIFLLGNVDLTAQRKWSLEKCIKHVQQNNTSAMRRGKLEVEKNKVIRERAEASRQPNLGFGTSLGLNLGRSIDPSTNEFGTQTTFYNNFSLDGNYTLYDGNRTKKRIEQARIEERVAEKDMEQLSKDLSLRVLQAYLRILMAEEQLTNAQKNLSQTESWYRLTQSQVRAGLKSSADLRNVEIQKSRDEQKIIDRQNFVERSYMELKSILEIDPSKKLEIEKPKEIPEPDEKVANLDFKKIFNKALRSQPGVEGGDLRLESWKLEEEIAAKEKSPRVDLFSGIYTNYSSAILDSDKPDLSNITIDTTIELGSIPEAGIGESNFLFFRPTGINFNRMGYLKQLGQNVGVGVGVNINVPILDRKASELNAEIAQINFLQIQEDNELFKQQLRIEIQNAIIDLNTSIDKLAATEKTLKLLEKQLVSMKKRLNLGNINVFEYTTLLNDRDLAQIEIVIAKYEFLLKKMIVDFYEGKKLKIEK